MDSRRRRSVLGAVVALLPVLAMVLVDGPAAPASPTATGRFALVGADPLLHRGMNSALAVGDDHVYVGSRTDGTHPDSGILVVDVADPADPEVVHQIGRPAAANPGESTRELRVWPEQDLLLSLNFECHPVGHACAGQPAAEVRPSVRFFDIRGERAARPRLVATYELPDTPHELFLWQDPRRPGRALLYITTPFVTGAEIDHEEPHLLVTDISGARRGRFDELLRWSPTRAERWDEAGLHSISVSPNGRRAYLADLEGGFLMADTTDLAQAVPEPRIRQLTPPDRAAHHAVPGVHSAVAVPGRRLALLTDEVYGRGFGLGPVVGLNVLQGCPWGWARLVDVRHPRRPVTVGEYRARPWNDPRSCDGLDPVEQQGGVSFSAHNPTLTENLALVSWHSAGLHAVDISDPETPTPAARFVPDPLPFVGTEDPILTQGTAGRTIVWSYPVVQDGLIYVTDIRNGLFILRYRGPHAAELWCRGLLEGNSNVGTTCGG